MNLVFVRMLVYFCCISICRGYIYICIIVVFLMFFKIFIEFINKRVWVEGGIIGVIMLMFIVIVF